MLSVLQNSLFSSKRKRKKRRNNFHRDLITPKNQHLRQHCERIDAKSKLNPNPFLPSKISKTPSHQCSVTSIPNCREYQSCSVLIQHSVCIHGWMDTQIDRQIVRDLDLSYVSRYDIRLRGVHPLEYLVGRNGIQVFGRVHVAWNLQGVSNIDEYRGVYLGMSRCFGYRGNGRIQSSNPNRTGSHLMMS